MCASSGDAFDKERAKRASDGLYYAQSGTRRKMYDNVRQLCVVAVAKFSGRLVLRCDQYLILLG